MKKSIVKILVGGIAGLVGASQLASAAEAQLDTVVVTGERLEETLSEELTKFGSRMETVEGQAIDRAGFDDTSQALQMLVPGLYVAPKNGPFDYVNVSLLGSRTVDTLWLVDGVRVSNRLYNTTTPLDTLPSNMIEKIEVLKGGQGLFYGTQAIAGVVNVVTKGFTKEFNGAVELGADSNDGQHVNGYLRGGSGSHAFVGYASYDQADGFQPFRDVDYQSSATDRDRSYDVGTAGLKYAFEPSEEFRFSASYQYTGAKLDFAYAEDAAESYNERVDQIASAKIDWDIADRISLYVKGYWHDWDSHTTRINNVLAGGVPTGATAVISDEALWRFDDQGINVLGEFRVTDAFTALVGYDFQKYGGRDDEFLIGQLTESVSAPFAQLRLDTSLLSGLTLAGGVRFNNPTDGEDQTVWNVSGKLKFTDEWFVRGQVGTSFRLPSAYELYVVDPCCEKGNPNLVAEKSDNVELGVGYAGDSLSVELIGFQRTIKNLIDIDYDNPVYPDGIIVNTDGEVKTQGAELVVNARLGKNWNFTFDYTHTDATVEDDTDQIDNIPVDVVKVIANWTQSSGRFGAGLAINHVGDVYKTIGGGVGRIEHGNYSVVDLSGFAFLDSKQHHRIGLRIENLFDEEYASQLQPTRQDVTDTVYAAWGLGAPLTGHLTYQYRF